MKAGEEDSNAHELVLIRRRAAGEEAPHKGGVWKIAYADFMTAMMAFFLVMWLINSTDQRVLTQVANYFNPMRLTDNTPYARGLNSIESGEQGKQGKQSSVGDPKDKHHANDSSLETKAERTSTAHSEARDDGKTANTARYTEQALFSDPYGVLARITAQAPKDVVSPGTAGDDYRDPFHATAQNAPAGTQPAKPKPVTRNKAAAPVQAEQETKTAEAANPAESTVSREMSPPVEKAIDAEAVTKTLQSEKATAADKRVREEAQKIETDIKQLASQLQGAIPSINVTVTDDGVLISITDDYDFGMFAIASAEPRPALVAVMERVGKVVQTYPQHAVTVRGHTDSRRYRSGTSDNWRLSTARAHMAYYMLVRGGVDEKRFDRIEGYADRSLRVPNDPEAAQNRRIEILLRRPKQ